MILYIILCGYPPFYGDTNKEILDRVKKGKIDFPKPDWQDKSNVVIDLINKMICEADTRFGAEQVLGHPWLASSAPGPEIYPILKSVFKGLQSLVSGSKFSRLLYLFLARQLNEKDLHHIEQAFNMIDKSGRGTIIQIEFVESNSLRLTEGGRIHSGLEEQSLKDIFAKVDVTGSKRLTYSQFIAGRLKAGGDGLVSEQLVTSMFSILDLDKDGLISHTDIQEFISVDMPHLACTPFLKSVCEEVKSGPQLSLSAFKLLLPIA